MRLAVCDGATESTYAARWANCLARTLADTEEPLPAGFAAAVSRAREEMARELDALKSDAVQSKRPLTWYQESALDRDAHATALAADLVVSDDGATLSVVAVGDTNLFVVEGNTLVTAFPLTHTAHFGTSPLLVASGRSDTASHQHVVSQLRLPPDATMILATDAVAVWLLDQHEKGRPAWDEAVRLARASREEFQSWARAKQERTELRDDDLTLIALRVSHMGQMTSGSRPLSTTQPVRERPGVEGAHTPHDLATDEVAADRAPEMAAGDRAPQALTLLAAMVIALLFLSVGLVRIAPSVWAGNEPLRPVPARATPLEEAAYVHGYEQSAGQESAPCGLSPIADPTDVAEAWRDGCRDARSEP